MIKTSDTGGNGRKARVLFSCERGGSYRKFKSTGVKKQKRQKVAGSKKCGCPFALKGQKSANSDDWKLEVVCGVHNHPIEEHPGGHSFAGRLSHEETMLLVDLSKNMVRPKDILNTLKERDANNVSTIKTIYNAFHKHKVAEKVEKSLLQQLITKLSEHQYIKWYRSRDKTEIGGDLFWTHPVSADLLRAFPRVLIIDCTSKAYLYRLPLLEIIGITSTEMTFSVAFAYVESEREDSYTWVLNRLKSMMDDGAMPEVIVTNRELALMNAIGKVFPTAKNLLCRWNINRSVLTQCKKWFETKEDRDTFMCRWNMLVFSSSEDEYMENLSELQREFVEYPEMLEYVTNTWLDKYKERFVAAWTNMIMHFGNVTTNK